MAGRPGTTQRPRGHPSQRAPLGRFVAGAGAAALVVAATCWSAAMGLLPGAPLLDGLAPPAAYRWVAAPPELLRANKAPAAATASVTMTDTGSTAATVATDDVQVQVVLSPGAFSPQPGQRAVQLAIQPLDPSRLAPLPPGWAIQGNAYRIDATYQPSGVTATPSQPVQVLLRYPVDATEVILLSGTRWQVLPSNLESVAAIVVGQSTSFGVLAAALTGVAPSRPSRSRPWAYAVAGLALLAAGIPALRHRAGTPSGGSR